MLEDAPAYLPKCVASTGSLYQCSIGEGQRREIALSNGAASSSMSKTDNVLDLANESNYFKSAQWYDFQYAGYIIYDAHISRYIGLLMELLF